MQYCVDTSAWVDAVRDYNPASKLFTEFWEFIESHIEAGTIIAPEEVHVEMKPKTLKDSREFARFIRQVGGILFVKANATVQKRFVRIIATYPELTTKGKPFAKSDGDAWVIALAQETQAVVVSHETAKPASLKPYKIPDVCAAEGVRHIRLPELLNELQGL